MKHAHKPHPPLSFSHAEGCKCGHHRISRDNSFEFSGWKLNYFRQKGSFQRWLKENSDARSLTEDTKET